MPTIKEKLQEDWKAALKAKDKFRANTISTAKSAILLVEKTDNVKLEDDEVINILAKEVKQRRESMLEFEKGNRQDLVDQCNTELEILLEYLPQQLSEEEIKQIVKDSAEEMGASSIKDMGKVMSAIRPKIVGRADGKLVSQIVKEYLNK
ncbi:GatB/YqeY domain-containing protein [Clostridium botulinum]|uniref:GatB/YqeY domain-containing protein n=1 Tax=Clostridium botulinum TaxID=1491 RepID=A0A0C2SMG9_CLOBO|nr:MULTISPECIES: GatB/YqeY domain-containing protein [Clostridium]ACD51500.1 GatB/Yqey domain protein [Clostridium botulinum E3 str. Alaska E43]AJF28889.1 aspartyl-tRNA amidotransferase [Clostridium botulinum]AJF31950.1 aspartyl-tRNA amidotransferase [Clostridium botulinum]EES49634.1 GatB/Yqey domain protein [Clostridium botulinum E1 str. 'BoNT E Beluga']KAI3350437.1 GatB/YqeY domain-containing protein [Clostridium botulinum]